jgi:hypothetical protein
MGIDKEPESVDASIIAGQETPEKDDGRSLIRKFAKEYIDRPLHSVYSDYSYLEFLRDFGHPEVLEDELNKYVIEKEVENDRNPGIISGEYTAVLELIVKLGLNFDVSKLRIGDRIKQALENDPHRFTEYGYMALIKIAVMKGISFDIDSVQKDIKNYIDSIDPSKEDYYFRLTDLKDTGLLDMNQLKEKLVASYRNEKNDIIRKGTKELAMSEYGIEITE